MLPARGALYVDVVESSHWRYDWWHGVYPRIANVVDNQVVDNLRIVVACACRVAGNTPQHLHAADGRVIETVKGQLHVWRFAERIATQWLHSHLHVDGQLAADYT